MPSHNPQLETTTVNNNPNDTDEKLKFGITNNGELVLRTEDVATASVVVPPDGGWGWVVMMASFCCNVVVDGIVFSAGAFQEPMRHEFNISKAQVRSKKTVSLLS